MISFEYFALLITTAILYWIIPKQTFRNILLVLSSYTFIYLMHKYVPVVVLTLSILSYVLGVLIDRYPLKAWLHTIGVCLLLGVLIGFKYLGFLNSIYASLAGFISALPRLEIRHLQLPLGISYIVFKHISYLTDIKWNLVKPGRFVDFLLYSSLFTIFVAGPIERFKRFKPQVERERLKFSWSDIDYGFTRIVFGMFKKLVLADWIGYLINPVWSGLSSYGIGMLLLALLGYSFQIYFDFSGYSDIAIGSSRFFGIRIMENFNNPYLASNLSQFWRRWHISLSDWIRDYLFFPLSELSTKRIWQIFFVPVITMTLCGLWHGPSWNYVIWGVWHGFGLCVLQLWNSHKRKHKRLSKATKTKWFRYAGVFTTFGFFTLGLWWFR